MQHVPGLGGVAGITRQHRAAHEKMTQFTQVARLAKQTQAALWELPRLIVLAQVEAKHTLSAERHRVQPEALVFLLRGGAGAGRPGQRFRLARLGAKGVVAFLIPASSLIKTKQAVVGLVERLEAAAGEPAVPGGAHVLDFGPDLVEQRLGPIGAVQILVLIGQQFGMVLAMPPLGFRRFCGGCLELFRAKLAHQVVQLVMVQVMPGRQRPSSDLSTRAARLGSLASAICSAAARRNGPRNTDSRSSTCRSVSSSNCHECSKAARRFRWRSGPSRLVLARKSRLRVISAAISPTGRTRTHGAASSGPTGMPSTNRVISPTGARVAESRAKSAFARRAGCTNSCTTL